MVDFSDVEAKRQIAESRQEQALGYSAKGQTLADELRKAIGERFAQSDVAKQGAESRTQFLSAAPQARADVSGLIQGGAILSPTQQQSIIASKRGAALAPVMGANVMQEAAFGTLEDLLNAGVNAWNAQSQYQTGMAGLAQQSYTSLLNELIQKSQIEAQQQQTALQQKQFGLTEAAAGREAELFPLQKEQLAKQIAQIGVKAPKEPDKYPWTEPYISAGLAGQQVSQVGNKLASEVQKQLNQSEATQKALGTQKQQLEAQKLQQELNYTNAPWWQRIFMAQP